MELKTCIRRMYCKLLDVKVINLLAFMFADYEIKEVSFGEALWKTDYEVSKNGKAVGTANFGFNGFSIEPANKKRGSILGFNFNSFYEMDGNLKFSFEICENYDFEYGSRMLESACLQFDSEFENTVIKFSKKIKIGDETLLSRSRIAVIFNNYGYFKHCISTIIGRKLVMHECDVLAGCRIVNGGEARLKLFYENWLKKDISVADIIDTKTAGSYLKYFDYMRKIAFIEMDEELCGQLEIMAPGESRQRKKK